jgi:hypothetical protein
LGTYLGLRAHGCVETAVATAAYPDFFHGRSSAPQEGRLQPRSRISARLEHTPATSAASTKPTLRYTISAGPQRPVPGCHSLGQPPSAAEGSVSKRSPAATAR